MRHSCPVITTRSEEVMNAACGNAGEMDGARWIVWKEKLRTRARFGSLASFLRVPNSVVRDNVLIQRKSERRKYYILNGRTDLPTLSLLSEIIKIMEWCVLDTFFFRELSSCDSFFFLFLFCFETLFVKFDSRRLEELKIDNSSVKSERGGRW